MNNYIFLFLFSLIFLLGYVQAHWHEDAFFGYQCLNGCNPLYIKKIHNLPPNLSVTSEMVRPFLPADSSLKQEMEVCLCEFWGHLYLWLCNIILIVYNLYFPQRGHVYLLDYEVLDQLPANIVNGKQTYLSAPLCLLHYNRDGELKPIAIQVWFYNGFLL